jgi:hypothetical protein
VTGVGNAVPTRLLAGVLLLVWVLTGCAETYDATTLGVPASLAAPAGQQPQGQRFSVTSHAVYGVWGIFRFKHPSLRKALAAQLGGGGAVTNVRIRTRSRWSDVLITGLTLGLIVPRSVTFEGVVTK